MFLDLFIFLWSKAFDNILSGMKTIIKLFVINAIPQNIVKYVIEVMDFREFCDEDKVTVNLMIVPTLQSLSEKNRKSVVDQFGDDIPTFDITEDIARYGLQVALGGEEFEVDDEDSDWEDREEIRECLNGIANIFETINSMRGFWLDRIQNGIGNTGWDFLNDYINDQSFTEAAFNRYCR